MAEINPTAINPFNRNSRAEPAAAAPASVNAANFWGEDGFSFGDILDLINPLQHIPVIGTLYRAVTGDDISTGSSIIGGALFGGGLFGGVLGVGAAVVNAIIEETTGRDMEDHIIAMFDGEATPPADGAPPDSAPAGGAPENGERDYAFNPAFGRGAQEATMTSPAFLQESPAGTTPLLAAARPIDRPVTQTLAAATARDVPGSENPASTTPREAVWLTALPRAESDFSAAAMRFVTPEAGRWLARAIAGNAEVQQTTGLNQFTHLAIDRYSQQAMAATTVKTTPSVVDIYF